MFGIPSLTSILIKLGLGVVAILAIFGFGYMKGSHHADLAIQVAATKAATKIAELEKENLKINDVNEIQFFVKYKTITEKQTVYVDVASNVVPNQHDLSNGWVYLHDAAVTMSDVDNKLAADPLDSLVKDNLALSVIVSNYAICEKNTLQLEQLQQWIVDTKQSVDKANK